MAVYSYKTGSINLKLIGYADQKIVPYADIRLYDFVAENNLFTVSSPLNHNFEKYTLSYNESSTLYSEFEDAGLLTDGEATIFDYKDDLISQYSDVEIKDILSPGSIIEDYGFISETAVLFDSAGFISDANAEQNSRVGRIISTSKYSITRVSEIQGTVFLFQGKSGVYINSSYIGYGDIQYSNNSTEKNTESYVGSARLFGFGSKAERVVASYNNSSVIFYESINYGAITGGVAVISDYANDPISSYASTEIRFILSPDSSSEDYGSILDVPNLPSERDNYGSIIGQGLRPFGSLRVVGEPIIGIKLRYIGSGSLFAFTGAAEAVAPAPEIGFGLFGFSGSLVERNTESYVGTGKAFGFGSKTEIFSRSPESSGLFKVFGSAIEKNTEDYVGSGSLFAFSSTTEAIVPAPEIGFGLFGFSGSLVERNTESYVGSGIAFGFGSKAERTAVSYNLSSVVSSESVDYGAITGGVAVISDYANTPISEYASVQIGSILSPDSSIEDYGLITEIANLTSEREDYGLITGRSARPFGLTRFSSATIEKNTESYVGSGSLFVVSSTTEAVSPAPEIGSGVLRTFGTSEENSTPSHVGKGKAFGFGSKEERTAVSYNLSSVVEYEGLDYGNITGGVAVISDYANTLISEYASVQIGSILSPDSSIEDYGSILDTPNLTSEREDYGLITGSSARPFGLFKIVGEPIVRFRLRHIGSGSLFAFIGASEAVAPAPEVASGLFRFSGSLVEKNTESYVGSGIAFGFGSKTEIFAASPESSGLFKVFGSAIEKNTEDYVGSGSIDINGSAAESITPATEIASVSINVGGAYSNLRNTESYVGSGIAFGFGSKAERTAVSYNLSSVVEYEGLDYGAITGGVAVISDYANEQISSYASIQINEILSPGSSIEDYGSILDVPNLASEREDYGLITGRSARPFGITRFSGSLVEKNTESYVGSGSLFAFSSTTEAVAPAPEVATGLFRFSGSALENNTGVHIGSGIAFGFGSKAERTAVSYNLSSVIEYEGLDYGNITGGVAVISDYANEPISEYASVQIGSILSPGSSIEDYGSILDIPNLASEREDYGLITGRSARPFGITRFSGSLVERNTESYVGSGSLFAFSSTAEAFGPSPEVSGLFRVFGSAAESTTPTTEIGSGSLFAFSSTTEAVAPAPEVASGLFRFSGSLVEKNTESYVGTGSLFAFSSTTEAFGPSPEVSGLFKIFGSATESNTPTTEIGSGSLIVRQQGLILDSENKDRIVAAYESVSFEEEIYPEAIKIRGEVGIYFQYFETGVGFLNVEGRAIIRVNPIHIGNGFFTINGSAAESTTPATEIGSGSLFAFVGASESKGSNPPENTQLFKFNGNSVERNTESYVGIGLERINVESLIIINLKYPGSGNIRIDSVSSERRDYSYSGIGKLFGFGIATEYLTNAYKLDTFVIKIRGFANESATDRFVGSGSIFTFVSASESKGSNPPEDTQLFKVFGSTIYRKQSTYNAGAGTGIVISKGRGLPDKNNKTYIISATESKVSREVEKPEKIKLSGSARTSTPRVYSGSGSIFTFVSKSEIVAFSPDDTKELFKISGNAIEKNTEAYNGSGSLFAFDGSTTPLVKTKEETTIVFRIIGSSSESFTEATYNGNGLIYNDIITSSKVSFVPKQKTSLFKFVGSAAECTAITKTGFGSISTIIGSSKSIFYSYATQQKAFKLFGTTFESFAKSNYNGTIHTIIDSYSRNRKVDYTPPKRTQIFIV